MSSLNRWWVQRSVKASPSGLEGSIPSGGTKIDYLVMGEDNTITIVRVKGICDMP